MWVPVAVSCKLLYPSLLYFTLLLVIFCDITVHVQKLSFLRPLRYVLPSNITRYDFFLFSVCYCHYHVVKLYFYIYICHFVSEKNCYWFVPFVQFLDSLYYFRNFCISELFLHIFCCFFGLFHILAVFSFSLIFLILLRISHNLCKFMFCQGDENDPELPYRDIAKFNIVQVAGTLNTFYHLGQLSLPSFRGR